MPKQDSPPSYGIAIGNSLGKYATEAKIMTSEGIDSEAGSGEQKAVAVLFSIVASLINELGLTHAPMANPDTMGRAIANEMGRDEEAA